MKPYIIFALFTLLISCGTSDNRFKNAKVSLISYQADTLTTEDTLKMIRSDMHFPSNDTDLFHANYEAFRFLYFGFQGNPVIEYTMKKEYDNTVSLSTKIIYIYHAGMDNQLLVKDKIVHYTKDTITAFCSQNLNRSQWQKFTNLLQETNYWSLGYIYPTDSNIHWGDGGWTCLESKCRIMDIDTALTYKFTCFKGLPLGIKDALMPLIETSCIDQNYGYKLYPYLQKEL